jgi:hypothetical protein
VEERWLDYLNVHYAEMHQAPNERKTIDGGRIVTRWSDAKHFFKRIEIVENGVGRRACRESGKVRPGFSRDVAPRVWRSRMYGDYHVNGYDAETSPD